MGEVYLAEDPALQRKVAVKVLRADFVANDVIRERFVREARSMAALQHQHIVPVFHIGYHEHTPYIVMPRLRGADLETWTRDIPTPYVKPENDYETPPGIIRT